MTFLNNLKTIITYDKQGLHELSLDDRSTMHALIVITILAIFETFFQLLNEVMYGELIYSGIISTFSFFEIIFGLIYENFYPEHLHIEVTISGVISIFLMFFLHAVMFSCLLAFFINKFGGKFLPKDCFQIVGLSFVFEIIFGIFIGPIRLIFFDTTIPWNLLLFIPLVFEFAVIFFGIKAISGISWEKVWISIIIAYLISILLAFILAIIIVKGIINDLFVYKPGLLSKLH